VRNLLSIIGRAFGLAAVWVLLAGTGAAAADGWQAPLRPVTVVRSFQPPPTPYAAGHRGVDLGGEPGQTVVAAAAGVISYAGPLAGRDVVVVAHGRLRTTYEPVKVMVRRGDRVSAGEQIGLLQAGHPGCPVRACLHWGLLRGETYLNPLSTLGKGQVRLLPLGGGAPPLPASEQVRATTVNRVGIAGPVVNPRVTWSVAAVAGAGVVMVRRRR
jgi:peptidase M23-like protein